MRDPLTELGVLLVTTDGTIRPASDVVSDIGPALRDADEQTIRRVLDWVYGPSADAPTTPTAADVGLDDLLRAVEDCRALAAGDPDA